MSEKKLCPRCNINNVYYYVEYCYDCLTPEEYKELQNKVVEECTKEFDSKRKNLSSDEYKKYMDSARERLEKMKQIIFKGSINN